MATGTVSRTGMGVARGSCGAVTGDGTALSVTLGFRPKKVEIFNETDVIKWEKYANQADANAVKTVAAGTMTKDTGSAIVLSDSGFVASATVNASGKALVWYAE